MLNELSPEQVKSMGIIPLVQRMDEVRLHAMEERYGNNFKILYAPPHPPFELVGQIMATKAVSIMSDDSKRRLADCAFRFLLQMDLLSVSAGISNREVFGPDFNEMQWKSPLHWMKVAVLDQYSIVASRIALECFFELIFMADCGKRIDGDSKFKVFKKWVLKGNNPYVYFVGHMVKAFEFDRIHRQKEVHGTSRYPRSLLTLHTPDHFESNISNQLTNILLGVWQPLLQILDGKQPNSILVFDSCDDFARKYFESRSDPENFSQFVSELIADKMNNSPR